MFYKGKLTADELINRRRPLADSLATFWPNGASFPIMFCDVVGKETDNRSSTEHKGGVDVRSKFNQTEAYKTVRPNMLPSFVWLVSSECLTSSH